MRSESRDAELRGSMQTSMAGTITIQPINEPV